MTEPAQRRTAPAAGAARLCRSLVRVALLLALLAAGCELGPDEAHLAPNTPLLPPTSEVLGAPTALTPTTAAPTAAPVTPTADPADGEEPAAEGDGGNGDPDGTEKGEPDQNGEPDENGEDGENSGDGDGNGQPVRLEIVLIGELDHSPTAFTQGLEISNGRLYESTGAPGDRSSSIRELSRSTGDVLRLQTIEEDLFAEGLTFVDGSLFQLTWQDGVALVWNPEEFAEIDRFEYDGQGWGLCFNGRVLVMSDGSAELHFRDPVTFERAGNPVAVTLDGEELPSLNELECVGDKVWANVWLTDLIVEIDPVTGRVTSLADASELGLPRPDNPNAVLNGIAYDPATETFLLAGKDWPAIYEVQFVPVEVDADASTPDGEETPPETAE